jgi:hypothetical protein
LAAAVLIVGQLHYIVEESLFIVAAHLEDADLAGIGPGNRLELLDARKFTLERPVPLEGFAEDNFNREILARSVLREPHFSIAAAAYTTQEAVPGNRWRLCRRTLGAAGRYVQLGHAVAINEIALR